MSPQRLTEASLHSARSGTILPTYDRAATRFGIVHIGPGAFHRAHQAFYVDTLLHSDKRWAISALSLKRATLRERETRREMDKAARAGRSGRW